MQNLLIVSFTFLTDEYVESEVRNRQYNFDNFDLVGIPIGNSKIKYSSIKEDLTSLNNEKSQLRQNLEFVFEQKKSQLLKSQFFIDRENIKFQNFAFEDFFNARRKYYRRRKPKMGLSEILNQLESLSLASKFIGDNQLTRNNIPGIGTLIGEMCHIKLSVDEISLSELKSAVGVLNKKTYSLKLLMHFYQSLHMKIAKI